MSESDKKRRLPLLPSGPTAEAPEEERPPWHWSAIGVVATFLVWLPLSALMAKLGARIADAAAVPEGAPVPLHVYVAVGGSQLLGFVIAVFAGGFLVGRFGGKAGRKEAATGGFITAAVAWALTAAQPASPGPIKLVALLVVMGGLAAGVGWLGGHVGLKKRHPAEKAAG